MKLSRMRRRKSSEDFSMTNSEFQSFVSNQIRIVAVL